MEIDQLLNTFFEFAQLPLTVFRPNTPTTQVPSSEVAFIPPPAAYALIAKHNQLTTGPTIPTVEMIGEGFFFAVINANWERDHLGRTSEQEARVPSKTDHYLLVGPAAAVPVWQGNLRKLSEQLGVPEAQRKQYVAQLAHTPTLPFRKFLALVSLVNHALTGMMVAADQILLLRPALQAVIEETLTHALFDVRESEFKHTPASFEHAILQAVTAGSISQVKQALLSPVQGGVGRMSADPLRQERYTFVSFATLITRAAIAGGLNAELAFSLSDVYCQSADKTTNLLDIQKLAMEMCFDFTQKVAATKADSRLSPPIATCCAYITSHLHDAIGLAVLPRLAKMSRKRLSKQFKAEVGLSLTEFIHRERIKEAQALLRHSDYSIAEIAHFLQFSSHSYFSTVFKRWVGVSPSEFHRNVATTSTPPT